MPPNAQQRAIQERIDRVKRRRAQRPGDNPGLQRKLKELRSSKLSLRKVDQDPKAPNDESKGKKTPPEAQGYTTGDVASVTSPPSPSSYTPPSGSTGLSSYQPQPGMPDPRDERYWRDVITLQQNRNESLRGLEYEQSQSKLNLDEALQGLTRQHPWDVLNLKEGANRAGEAYSSRTDESMGKLEQNLFLQKSGLQRDYDQESALRNLARDAIESGYSQDEVAALLDAVDRQTQAELDRPAPESGMEEAASFKGKGYIDTIQAYQRELKKAKELKKRAQKTGHEGQVNRQTQRIQKLKRQIKKSVEKQQ